MHPSFSLKPLLLVWGLGLSAFAVSPAYSQQLPRQEIIEKIQSLEQQLLMLKQELKLNSSIAVEPLNPEESLAINFETLFFNVSIPGTDVYAFNGTDNANNNAGDSQSGSHGDWNSNPFNTLNFGYRVSLDYDFVNSPWSIDASYMDLDTSTSSTTSIERGREGGRLVTIEQSDFDDTCDVNSTRDCSVKSTREIDLSHIRLGSNYDLQLNESVAINFGAGLQYADVQSSFRAEEDEGSTGGTEISTLKSSFTGVGPYVSSGVAVDIGSNILLSARANGGVLLGDGSSYLTDYSSDDGDCTSGGAAECRIEKKASMTTVPNYGFSVGIEWEKEIAKNTSLLLNGGYEYTQYFGAVDNSFYQAENEADSDFDDSTDLILHGFTVGIKLKYVF